MFPVGDSTFVPVGARKKRLHPDGEESSSSLSKRLFTVAESEQDFSNRSDAGTITCLGSAGKVHSRLIWMEGACDARDWDYSMRASEVSSPSAAVSSSVDCFVDGPSAQCRDLRHTGKSKANVSMNLNHSESRRLDADLEVNSVVTLQRGSNMDGPVFGLRSDNEPSGESVARIVRYADCRRNESRVEGMPRSMPVRSRYECKRRERRPTRQSNAEVEISYMQWTGRNMAESCPSVADESGSSCGEPSEDSISEDEGLRSADVDVWRPSVESSLQVDETEIQSARFSGSRGDCIAPFFEKERDWEQHFVVARSTADSENVGSKVCEREGQKGGYNGDEYCAQLFNDIAKDDAPRPSYVLSSGRMSQEEVARLGRRPPTIDRDFEEYFSSLML